MKHWWIYLITYLVLVVAIALGIGSLNVPRYAALRARAVQADGVIVRPTCDDHGTLEYRFRASGHEILSHGSAERNNCESARTGDRVSVWYLPDQPEVSTLGRPQDVLGNELVSVGLAVMIVPAFLLLGFMAMMRRIFSRV
jgi:hypothetical protein